MDSSCKVGLETFMRPVTIQSMIEIDRRDSDIIYYDVAAYYVHYLI
jgi:hypothetical protein